MVQNFEPAPLRGGLAPSAPTMQDVARLAGVSAKTVSNVVNGHPNVSERTRASVERAIAHLGYKMNVTARNLRRGTTGLIALALPELRNPYFAELADSIVSHAEASNYRVLITQTGYTREGELEVLVGSQHHLVDGVIFSPVQLGPEDVRQFAVEFPLVVLGESVFDTGNDHVTMSNVEAARAATEHLIGLGRRRIALLGVAPDVTTGASGLRRRGYVDALVAHQLPVLNELQIPTGWWQLSSGAEATKGLIRSGIPFDAIFALNDSLALGALSELTRAGLRIPEDVAVIGFDDTEAVHFSNPPLSSVEPGRESIARMSVEMLLRRITQRKDAEDSAPRRVEVPFAVKARQSTLGHDEEQEAGSSR